MRKNPPHLSHRATVRFSAWVKQQEVLASRESKGYLSYTHSSNTVYRARPAEKAPSLQGTYLQTLEHTPDSCPYEQRGSSQEIREGQRFLNLWEADPGAARKPTVSKHRATIRNALGHLCSKGQPELWKQLSFYPRKQHVSCCFWRHVGYHNIEQSGRLQTTKT